MLSKLNDLLPQVVRIAKLAGEAIMPFYQSQQLSVSKKMDETPLTNADVVAHQFIIAELAKISDLPILSEEGTIPPYEVRAQWSQYWLIDPLDGTRGFIHGSDEFTVNIALIWKHQPVLGVVYVPVHQAMFFACRGGGAFARQEQASTEALSIHSAQRPFEQLRFVVGKYHRLRRIQQVMDCIPQAELIRLNSSLKFVVISQGRADVYPRFGRINEWDTAAGHCILEEGSQ